VQAVQRRGWGSRFDSRCSAPASPPGVPSANKEEQSLELLRNPLHARPAEPHLSTEISSDDKLRQYQTKQHQVHT